MNIRRSLRQGVIQVASFETLPDNGGASKPSRRSRLFGRGKSKGASQAPEVHQATQRPVARPKRQIHPVVKRTYGSLHTLLRVLQPVNAIVVLGIMFAVITKLHGWHLFSFVGVGIGLGLVAVELLIFSQVWRHYQLTNPTQSNHLIKMGFFGILMLAVAVAAVYHWQDHKWSMLLVLAVVVASVDPMEVANVGAEKRSVREEVMAEMAEAREAAQTNLRNTSIVLQQVNELVPGINEASGMANTTIQNATTLVGVLGDQEKAISRRVDAQLQAEKPVLMEQIRAEERAKAQADVERMRQEMQAQVDAIVAQYQASPSAPPQPQPAARPTAQPTNLPGYPGPSQSSDASHTMVPGEVISHD